MSAVPLPEGNNAAEMIRRLRAIDAEIFGTLYAKAGIIGGDVVINGDLIANDIYSEDWVSGGGAVPLSLPDASATTGYALQSDTGVGQFESLYASGEHITDLPTANLLGVITTAQLDDLAVTAEKIAALAVTTAKLAADAVTAGQLADDAVGTEHVQALAINSDKLAALAVTEAKLADGAVVEAKLADLAVTQAKVALNAIDTAQIAADAITAGQLADLAVDTEHIQALAISAAKIDALAVTTAKLALLAVDTAQIAAGAVEAAKIGALAVETGKLALDAVTGAQLADLAVGEEHIEALAISTAKVQASAITATQIGALAVETGKLALDAVTDAQLADLAVGGEHIQALSIVAGQIAANTITAGQIAANTITAAEIFANTITASEIAANTITAAEIAALTITAAQIVSGTITTTQIDANTITAANIAANTITAAEIFANTITAAEIAANTITASQIFAATITSGEIAANTITSGNILANTIEAGDIKANTITANEIDANTITAAEIVAGTITGTEIDADTITAANIAALTVTAAEIAANTVTAAEIAALTITASEIAVGTITATELAANSVTASEISVGAVEYDAFDTGLEPVQVVADLADITSPATGQVASVDGVLWRYTGTVWVGETGRVWTANGGDVAWSEDDSHAVFPGTSGDYISTPDVNLLDADTAHLQQSHGVWFGSSGAINLTTSSVLTPTFGTSHGQWTTNLSNSFGRTPIGTDGFPISSSTQYTARYDASQDNASATCNITMLWYKSNGDSTGFSENARTSVTVGTLTEFSITATSPSDAAFVALQIGTVGGTSGDKFYWDSVMIAEGSSTTFVPSLRIVGDVDLRTKIAHIYPGAGEDQIVGAWEVNNMAYRLTINSDGKPVVGYSDNGTTVRYAISSSALAAASGVTTEVRLTLDLDAGAGGIPQAKFYENGSLLSTVDTNGIAGDTIFLSGADVTVGMHGNGISDAVEGDMFWVEIRDGIDGPVVARFDAGDFPGGPEAWTDKTPALQVSGTVVGTQIRDGVITTQHILANTIVAGDIAADTITANEIAADTITATQIAADTITAAEIAADTITAAEIAADTITAAEIAALTITASQIAAGTITATEILVNTITAAEIAANTVTATEIVAGTITVDELELTMGLRVGQTLQSTVFTPGSVGWGVLADGSAEFNNVLVRGEIDATSGELGDLDVTGTLLLGTGGILRSSSNAQRVEIGDIPNFAGSEGVVFYTDDAAEVDPAYIIGLDFIGGPSLFLASPSEATKDATLLVLQPDNIFAITGGTQLFVATESSFKTEFTFHTESFGSAGSPSFSWDDDPDTGTFRVATNQLAFAAGGLEQFRTGNSGNPGIRAVGGKLSVMAFGFQNDLDTGMYRYGLNHVALAAGGVVILRSTDTETRLPKAYASGGGGDPALHITSSGLLRHDSSLRVEKKDIDYGFDPALIELKPVTFEWRKGGVKQYGFIADDLAAQDKRLGLYDDDSKLVDFHLKGVVAILAAKIDRLEKRLQELEK